MLKLNPQPSVFKVYATGHTGQRRDGLEEHGALITRRHPDDPPGWGSSQLTSQKMEVGEDCQGSYCFKNC